MEDFLNSIQKNNNMKALIMIKWKIVTMLTTYTPSHIQVNSE